MSLDIEKRFSQFINSPGVNSVLKGHWGDGEKVVSLFEMTDAADMLKGQHDPKDKDISVAVMKVAEMGACSCMVKWCPQCAIWAGSVS